VIEEHIIKRFKIKRSSIHMSITQDKAKRFTLRGDGVVGLCIWKTRGTSCGSVQQLAFFEDDDDE